MKTTILRSVTIASLRVSVAAACAHYAPTAFAAAQAPAEVGIHILEDVSGSEIEQQGIKPADFDDMPVLGDVIFRARTTGLLGYDVVDENGGDNKPLRFSITPFDQPVPTRKTFGGMTVREKALALRRFEEQKRTFLATNTQWRERVLEGARNWFDECITRRMEVEEAFLQRLKANHNRDYRGSDLNGSVQIANELLAGAKKRFLILNTDMEHKPGKTARDQAVRALNHADLAQEVVIIMVNTTNKPDQSPLLNGLPNKILHADSLKDAAEVITKELSSP